LGPAEFGGDPAKTFATLDAATKDRLSHRGKALRALASRLPALLGREGPRNRPHS